jgi:hypothetical protein
MFELDCHLASRDTINSVVNNAERAFTNPMVNFPAIGNHSWHNP